MISSRKSGFLYQTAGKSLVFIAVGLLVFGWLLATPPGLLGKADAVGYAVCHRIDARSFHLGERQAPLCARCTGMFLGALLGLAFQHVTARRRAGMPHWSVWPVLFVFFAAFAIDGLNSYLHLFPGAPELYKPDNLWRLLTGTGMGLLVAVALYPTFNQTVWKRLDTRPAMKGLRALAALLLLALLMDWLVWIENPLLLFVFGLLSALGVLLLLTMIYTVFWMMLLKADNQIERLAQMALPLALGFGTSIAQIALFNLGRYWLTGTWDGFHLG
ncbi:MAG: DUF2085 domain-containing protein [Anaerolineales bacterium]|nr:DUF2085 domain-containing protein [Anaerolineales bacterium]